MTATSIATSRKDEALCMVIVEVMDMAEGGGSDSGPYLELTSTRPSLAKLKSNSTRGEIILLYSHVLDHSFTAFSHY